MILDLETIYAEVRRQRRLFALIVASATALSIITALLSRPVFRGEIVVGPAAEDSGGLSSLPSGLGGLASLAGGLLSGSGHWKESVAVLHSRHLLEALVTRDNLLPVLFPKQQARPPTMGDAVYMLQNSIVQIREDTKTGLVTVRVDWFDRNMAAAWANDLVALADEELRTKSATDAQSALEALQRELEKTDAVELRSTIAHLMEAQLKTKAVAGVRAEYAYRVIDRAVPADPNRRVKPTRTLMVLAGTGAGVLLGVMVVMLRSRRSRGS